MLVDQYGQPLQSSTSQVQRRGNASLHGKYDAAQDTAENRKHWSWADHDSALASNSIEVRRRLRSRARYECHQANSFANGICQTLANDTISTGPTLQAIHPIRELARFIEIEWRKWARAVRLASKLRTARLSKVIDGEIFILKSTNNRLRTPVRLDIKLVEADQISTPGFADGLPNQVDGIEFDKWGQPTVYHMLKTHPGDIWALGSWQKDDIDPDDMIHMFRVTRPGQVRGVPEITPALPLFAYLRRWTLATIAASETAANLSAVLETTGNDFDDEGGPEDVEPFSQVPIDRNMLVSMPRGWRMSQFKPEQPTTNYEVFRNAILNEIARCVHMPSNKALADSSRYNYSSGRLDHQTYYEAIDVERSQWDVECLDRIFEWWLDEALMISGYIPSGAEDLSHEWRWNPAKHVDPQKEVGAAIDAIEAGLLTEEQYLLSQNIDPELHYRQLRRQARRRRRLMELGGPLGTESATPAGSAPKPSAAPMAQNANGQSQQLESESPTGEFRNMNRRQQRNTHRGIDEALEYLAEGIWSETRARVSLGALGLEQATIDKLIEEIIGEPELN